MVNIVSNFRSGAQRWSKYAFLPLCLLSRGVKIVSDLTPGGLKSSKFAFLPFTFYPGG